MLHIQQVLILGRGLIKLCEYISLLLANSNAHCYREDCYHLSKLLPEFKSERILSSEQLTQIFATLAEKRRPRTAALVKGARARGEDRVVEANACDGRDQRLRLGWGDDDSLALKYDYLLKEPFEK